MPAGQAHVDFAIEALGTTIAPDPVLSENYRSSTVLNPGRVAVRWVY